MSPGKGASKKEKKKPIPVKTSLNNPYNLKWSLLEREHVQFIINTVKDKLTAVGLHKKRVSKSREWGSRRRSRKKAKQESTDEPKSITEPAAPAQTPSEPAEPCWTNAAVRNRLAIGINEVTKGLERNELGLVLVCNSVTPAHMTCHLIPLSKTRSVPACQVPRLSESIAGVLGLKCVLALGFKRDAGEFADVVGAITPVVPPLNVTWVPTDLTPDDGEEEEEHKHATKGLKRKLDEASEESPIILQPLKVKKIIPNPSKIRKDKKKGKQK